MSAPLVILIGASTLWRPECVAERRTTPDCVTPGRALAYTDEDTWRMAFAWWGHDTLVLTQPDAEVAHWRMPDGSLFAAHVAGPPTLAALRAALAGARSQTDGTDEANEADPPDEIVLFVASHGTEAGLHLDDGVIPPRALVALLEAETGASVRLVVEDACMAGRMVARGEDPLESRIGLASFDGVEVGALSETHESRALRGGYFTLLMTSALLGGADRDEDLGLLSGDLERYVYAYAPAMPADFEPSVRAPRGSTVAPVPTPASTGLLSLSPGDDGRARRWAVSVDQGGAPVWIVHLLVSPAQASRILRLPAGTYRLWWADYVGRAGVFRLDPAGFGHTCTVALREGETLDGDACAAASLELVSGRGAEASSSTLPGEDGAAARAAPFVALLREVGPPVAGPSGDLGFHARQRGLLVELAWQSALLDRGVPLLGARLGVVVPPAHDRGRWRAEITAALLAEPPSDQPAPARILALSAGPALTAFAAPLWRVDVGAHLGPELVLLAGEQAGEPTWGALAAAALEVGPSVHGFIGTRGLVSVGAAWAPRYVWGRDPGGGSATVADVRGWGTTLGFGARL